MTEPTQDPTAGDLEPVAGDLVLIGGTGRSGTHILGRLLGTGDETAVLATVRQVRASPEAVGHDLVEEDVDAVGIAVGAR